MSDIIGFLFGGVCGLLLGIVLMMELSKNEITVHKNNLGNPKVIKPYQNCTFYGYQAEGTLDLSNPPHGGSGVPKKISK